MGAKPSSDTTIRPVERPAVGRRERKKHQTRELIAETARRLFVEYGFEHVTISDIARQADVSETTVFNHFRTKEDLVYWRMTDFEDEMLETIRDRRAGESILAAFGRFALTPRGLLAQTNPQVVEHLALVTCMITDSPALLAREQHIFERYTASLAALLALETDAEPDDVAPWVAANALVGIHRALTDYTRTLITGGARHPALARAVRAQGRRAIATLEQGLGRYGVRRTPASTHEDNGGKS